MSRVHALAACLLAGVAPGACGDDGPPASADGDVAVPEAERLQAWARQRPGEAVPVAIAFEGVVSDSAVVLFLQDHSLEPFGVFISAADLRAVHAEPREDASMEVIGRARAEAAAVLTLELCAQRERAAAALEPDSPDGPLRAVLSDVRRMRTALRGVRLGAPIVVGIQALGTPADVEGALTDPRARSLTVAPPSSRDEDAAPEPSIPGGILPRILPRVAAMPPAEVVEQARTLAEDGLEGCMEKGPARR